jgi:hypothetical protein
MITKKQYEEYYVQFGASADTDIVCYFCKKSFNMEQQYYALCRRHNARTNREIYFHERCFFSIAGKSYTFEGDDK